MPQRIMQFGTSRFLQAHADLFVHQARQDGQDIGPITIVKTTGAGQRDGRVAAFHAMREFPVRLRGYEDGTLIDEVITVKGIAAAYDAHANWQQVKDVFAHQTEIVFSNVGDSGFAVSVEDSRAQPTEGSVPKSFAAKLLLLLKYRFEQGARPLLILPCELINDNGLVLRHCLQALAAAWALPASFNDWLASEVTICNTLVDRIVSEAIEPIGAIAEPYGLWAIQWGEAGEFPFQDFHVVLTGDLEPFARLKLHILNLGHTYLTEIWKSQLRAEDETVRDILQDARVKSRLINLYEREIIPGFGLRNMAEPAARYMETTMQRFENPFLKHRISDIYQNHKVKMERRFAAFIDWTNSPDPAQAFPELCEMCDNYLIKFGR
ncbi:mannitol dehydrogenase family protein [Aestuariivirga litoralis]|uniref:mannitol dehydrogenase family protein n=1 Tax=Aestuariivirga litoralis TaxID=2650924 RepID=UPI0018C60899|nr:mannitol dehydrogenase family protein [Aestuariivirga litoralis]MBG1230760.1 mannitol dehydrogenase family protein [Aestuariivirga litoralis]